MAQTILFWCYLERRPLLKSLTIFKILAPVNQTFIFSRNKNVDQDMRNYKSRYLIFDLSSSSNSDSIKTHGSLTDMFRKSQMSFSIRREQMYVNTR